MKAKNKWKEWAYDFKYTSVRRKIKRKTNKAERKYWKDFIKKAISEEL